MGTFQKKGTVRKKSITWHFHWMEIHLQWRNCRVSNMVSNRWSKLPFYFWEIIFTNLPKLIHFFSHSISQNLTSDNLIFFLFLIVLLVWKNPKFHEHAWCVWLCAIKPCSQIMVHWVWQHLYYFIDVCQNVNQQTDEMYNTCKRV